MSSLRNVTVIFCDYEGCSETTFGRQPDWWASKAQHYCPEHWPTCARCDVTLRPQRKSVADFPGTVRVGWGGLCETCAQSKRRAEQVPAIDTVDPKQVRYVKRKIAEWLEDPDDRLLVLGSLGLSEIGDDID